MFYHHTRGTVVPFVSKHKKLLILAIAGVFLALQMAVFLSSVLAHHPDWPSTNSNNTANNQPNVELLGSTENEVTLGFNNPKNYSACFEYRADGAAQTTGSPHPAAPFYDFIPDDEVKYDGNLCITNTSTSRVVSAVSYVEVRHAYGAEHDAFFDWTPFYVSPDVTKPTVSINPGAPKYLSGTESFEITINDNKPLDPSKNKEIWVELYGDPDWSQKKGQKVNLSSGTGIFTINTTTLPDGKYVLRVGSVKDTAGNTSGDKSFKHFYIDNTRPTISLFTPTSGSLTNGNFTIHGTAYDANGIDKVLIYVGRRNTSNVFAGYVLEAVEADWDGTHFTYEVTGLPEFDGTYYVRAFAYDPAGNNRSAGADNITVDTTPPVVTVNPVAGSLLSGTVTFEITVTDDNLDPGMPNTWVYLYNHLPPQKQKGASINFASGFNTFTVDTTLLDDGLASLNVGKLKDAAGNWSGVKDNYFSKYVIDNTAPEMPIHLSPANNSSQNFNNFWFDWTDVSDAVSYEVQFSQNNSTDSNGSLNVGVWSGDASHNQPTESRAWSSGANGTWYWQVRSVDAAGNKSAWTTPWKMTIDMVAPDVPDAQLHEDTSGDSVPNGGFTDEQYFYFLLNSSDDTTRYQLKYWNDIPGSIFKESTPWTQTNLSGYMPAVFGTYEDNFTQGEGVHYFAFSACDAANNCSTYSTPYSVTYDKTAPSLDILAITTGDTEVEGTVDGDAASVEVSFDDGITWVPAVYTPGETSWTSPIPPLSDGVHTVLARATDAAGNTTDPVAEETFEIGGGNVLSDTDIDGDNQSDNSQNQNRINPGDETEEGAEVLAATDGLTGTGSVVTPFALASAFILAAALWVVRRQKQNS